MSAIYFAVHAEETLASLNFAPDAFEHNAERRASTASKKSRESKGGYAGDYPNSPTMYFVQTLPIAEQALPLPRNPSPYNESQTTLPQQQRQSQGPQQLRPLHLAPSDEKDRSFFKF